MEEDGGVTIIRKTLEAEGVKSRPPPPPPSEDKDSEEIPSSGGRAGPPKANRTPLGFMVQGADGSTLHPKLSNGACRVLVFILGIFLSLFNAKYFMVTFFSWEVAVYSINGFPLDEASSSSSVILLVALLGLNEKQLRRFKLCLKLGGCLITDLSILIVSALTSRVIYENVVNMALV